MDDWPGVSAPSKKDVSGSEYITSTRMMQGFYGRKRQTEGDIVKIPPYRCTVYFPARRLMASAMTRVLKRMDSTGQLSSGMWHWAGSSSGSMPNATALTNERA